MTKKKKLVNTSEIEMRSYPIELRVDEEKNKIVGYAAVFNQLSEDLGGFREKINKGTFKESIEKDDIVATRNHNNNFLLGRNKSGTLILSEDKKGLKMEIDPPDTTYAKDLIVSMERGDINQCSFAFRTLDDVWNSKDKNNIIRTLKKATLRDVAIVTGPGYPQTKAQYRSTEEVYKDFIKRDLQEKEELDKKIAFKQELKALGRSIKLYIIKKVLDKE